MCYDLNFIIEKTTVEPRKRRLSANYKINYHPMTDFIKSLSYGEFEVRTKDLKILVKDVNSLIVELLNSSDHIVQALFGGTIGKIEFSSYQVDYYTEQELNNLLEDPEYSKKYPEYAI